MRKYQLTSKNSNEGSCLFLFGEIICDLGPFGTDLGRKPNTSTRQYRPVRARPTRSLQNKLHIQPRPDEIDRGRNSRFRESASSPGLKDSTL